MKITRKTRPIENYLEANYPVTVYRNQTGGYVAEVEDLIGCVTEGESLDEVFTNIENIRRNWIEIQYEDGVDIPIPRSDQEYSGKFIVRLPKGLHRRLVEQARREAVSLNQYVETSLASQTAVTELVENIEERLRMLSEAQQIVANKTIPQYSFVNETQISGKPSFPLLTEGILV